MQKTTITCEHCGEEFQITLKDVSCNETNVGTRCPKCGIRTSVTWMTYTSLGGSAPEYIK